MDQISLKKTSLAGEINGLASLADQKPPRITPGSPADIAAAQAELDAWSRLQPTTAVRLAAIRVIRHLKAARIGARPNPYVKAMLIEEVGRLAQAKGAICRR